jgi:hypothetical protein
LFKRSDAAVGRIDFCDFRGCHQYVATMKLGLPGLALIAASASFGVSVAIAQNLPQPGAALQPPFAQPPYKNLKVFPKDVSRADLISNMKFFSQSLGVRCTYCHVGEEGKPLSTFDFASDAKDHLNSKDLPDATGLPDAKVTCYTCHRGSTKPLTAPPPGSPNTVPPPPGAAPPSRPAEAVSNGPSSLLAARLERIPQ